MYDTVQLIEVVWTLVALPGLWFWYVNMRAAMLSRRLIVSAHARIGFSLWANFSVLLTGLFVFVEGGFAATGILAMTTVPGVEESSMVRWVVGPILVACSLMVSYAAFRWRAVHKELLSIAGQESGASEQ